MKELSDRDEMAPILSTPAELELLTRVATLYYLEDLTQVEVAKALKLSRPKVGRLLERARQVGVVDISVKIHPSLSIAIETEMTQQFGLSRVLLAADQTDESGRRAACGKVAAALLEHELVNGDVVAVGMGRNVGSIPPQLSERAKHDCTFVSAIGGSPVVDAGVNPNEICRRLALTFGGRSLELYAPAYAENARVRQAFMSHVDVRETLEQARSARMALVGVGNAQEDSAVVQMGCFTPAEMSRIRDQGAVGDILGSFFDIQGRPIQGGMQDRVVALNRDELTAIPLVVAVSSEPDKVEAILGALRSGIVGVLVSTLTTARSVLAMASATVGTVQRPRRQAARS